MAQNNPKQPLLLQTFVSTDVSAATYYLESRNEGVLIDPSIVLINKIKEFLKTRTSTLKYILLTHIPTSHILGHLEFQNVEVLVGGGIKIASISRNLEDHQKIKIGDLTIQYINTRNYSIEGGCYVVRNESETGEKLVFGGPDLIYGGGMIQEKDKEDNVLEGKKELSLQSLGIEADIKVYPPYTSPGYHRFLTSQTQIYSLGQIINGPKVNFDFGPYYTSDWSKEVHRINKTGPFNFESTKQNALKLLSTQEFDQLRPSSIVLDIRQEIPDLEKGTVLDSYIIPPNGNLGLFVNFLMKDNKPVIVISKPQLRQELADRLLNIGVSNILGFNSFPLSQWISANKPHYLPKFTSIKDIKLCPQNILVDSRTPGEWKQQGIAENARCVYFPFIEQDIQKNADEYKKYQNIYVYCRMGYRARIGGSMFEMKGWKNVSIVPEPWTEIKNVVNVVPYKQA